jgi:hypothetical protein
MKNNTNNKPNTSINSRLIKLLMYQQDKKVIMSILKKLADKTPQNAKI